MPVLRSALVVSSTAAVTAAVALGATPEQRARDIVSKMTLDEKVSFAWGKVGDYVGMVPADGPVTSLGIPQILMNDGPQGFRDNAHLGSTTSWPSGLTVASSWDPELAGAWGEAMGEEFRDKGSNVQLGPGLCVARVPRNGRNFEYLSGEDPKLGATLVGPVIKGIQSKGVIANAKHYALNNQETNRGAVSANCDERTRWEIYYPPFQAAVDAGVGSIMCSYNKINGVYSCENPETLADLKDRMGFKGWVMSDWGATHSTVAAANAGLDQEMAERTFFGDKLKAAVQDGNVTMATLNDKVERQIAQMIEIGCFDNPSTGSINNNVTSDAHNAVARELVSASTVMVKNAGGVLPFDLGEKVKNIAVVGDAGHDSPIVHGGGSGQVIPAYTISALDGLRIATAGRNDVNLTYAKSSENEAARSNVLAADVVLFVMGTSSSEGSDRGSLDINSGDEALLNSLVGDIKAAGKKTPVIVAVTCPGAVLLPFADEDLVTSILVSFMPGQEYGNGLADLLVGKVSPSGRLALTFPKVENEIQFTQKQWPGYPDPSNPANADYSEKLEVGYRWYNEHPEVTPQYAFGHGLGYADFSFSDLTAMATEDGADFTFKASCASPANGPAEFKTVAQLYITYPDAAGEPRRQLKAFEKISFSKKECSGSNGAKQVSLKVTNTDLSTWSVDSHSWQLAKGTFKAVVSRDSSTEGSQAQASFRK